MSQQFINRPLSEVQLAIDRYDCERSLAKFTRAAWKYINPQRMIWGWHMDAISEHLEAVTAGEIPRLIINVPPRMTKSTTASVAWPAWTWAQPESRASVLAGPGVQFMTGSYAKPLATRDATKTRRLINSQWYQDRWGLRFQLTDDQNAKDRYDNTKGGYRLVTSIDAGATGEGGDIIVVDDPHNTISIESEITRDTAIRWWDEVMGTRLNDMASGAYVLIMQRLYQDDLTGHILDTTPPGEWVHLMLPMEYEPNRHCVTVLGWEDPRIEPGELLCPERVGEKELRTLKRRLGDFGTAGQLQQRPAPRGGGILREDYWKAWPPGVEDLVQPSGKPLAPVGYPVMDFILASVDTALSEKEEADYSAMTIWGLWRDRHDMPNLMLMEAWHDRVALHGLVTKLIEVCTRRSVDRLLIEAKSAGQSAAQEIQRLARGSGWSTVLEPVKGDKVARAWACQPTFQAGQVWAPARNKDGYVLFLNWAQMVIDEASIFPKGSNDDLVDTVTQAINHFRRTGMLLTKDDRVEQLNTRNRPPGRPVPLYGVMQ